MPSRASSTEDDTRQMVRAFVVLVPVLVALLVVAGNAGQMRPPVGDPKGRLIASLGGRFQRAPAMTKAGAGAGPQKTEVLSFLSTGSGGPGAPGAATSTYMTSTVPAGARGRGCHFGHHVNADRSLRDSIVVLDFGRPARIRSRYGVSLFGHRFRTAATVASAAEAYAEGFARCSRRASDAHLVLAVGTSNYGREVSRRHGAVWAGMVNDIAAWVASHGFGDRVAVAGAMDTELAWNGPGQSRRWVDGYGSIARHPYFDFGDAAGCPPAGRCVGAWRMEDVWYVAWGARWALPLPEIYAPNGSSARQWQQLSLYSKLQHGRAMTIAGVMSQHAACRQSSDPCWGMNNSPARAWRLLSRALNSDGRTAQTLRWVTDVRWGR